MTKADSKKSAGKKIPIYSYSVRGGIKYEYKLSIRGKQYIKKGFDTEDEAFNAACVFLADFGSATTKTKKYPTIDVVFRSYLKRYKDTWKCGSYNNTSGVFKNYLIGKFPNIPIDRLTYGDFLEWHNKLAFNKSMDYTRKNKIQRYLCLAMEHCDIFFDFRCRFAAMLPPFKRSVIRPTDFEKRKTIPQEDIVKFFRTLKESAVEQDYLRFLVAYETGIRFSECRGLPVDSFSESLCGLIIYQQVINAGEGRYMIDTPKSKTSVRLVLISNNLMHLLKDYIARHKLSGSDYLFYGRTKKHPRGGTSIRRDLNRYCDMAKIDRFTFRQFRSTRATQLEAAGVSIDEIGDYLGHSTTEVTKRYYIRAKEIKTQKIINVLDDAFKSVVADGE